MCEGEACGNKWMHRYCAGVPTTHYKLLENSPSPYYCYLCAQLKQTATIEEMKGTIASLSAEIVELRAALESQKATNESTQTTTSNVEDGSRTNGRSWSEVVRRGNRPRARNSKRPPRTSQANGNHRATPSNSRGNQTKKTPSNWIKVNGARKIWGTLKSCTVASVKSAISRVCNNDTVNVKRKLKTGEQTRWWFVLHDSEEALTSLESKWEQLEVQTSWKLVKCYMPQFEDQTPANETSDQVQTTPTNQSQDHDTNTANDPSQIQENTFLEGETAVVS